LIKALPHPRYLFVTQTNPRVDHRHADCVVGLRILANTDRDPAPIRRELQRIAQEALQHVIDLLAVGLNLLDVLVGDQTQIDLPSFSLRLEPLDCLIDQRHQVDRVDLQTVRPGLQAGVVQKPVHQFEQAVAGCADIADVSGRQRREWARQAAQQHVGVAHDRRQRRAQLVAHDRQKLVLLTPGLA